MSLLITCWAWSTHYYIIVSSSIYMYMSGKRYIDQDRVFVMCKRQLVVKEAVYVRVVERKGDQCLSSVVVYYQTCCKIVVQRSLTKFSVKSEICNL